jgi:hypothetical protein
LKVLIVGGGGREHALAWKCAQSSRVREVLVAPGNAGTDSEPRVRNVAVAASDIAGLLELARREAVDLTIIGPEAPLVAGIAMHSAPPVCPASARAPGGATGGLEVVLPRPSCSGTAYRPRPTAPFTSAITTAPGCARSVRRS